MFKKNVTSTADLLHANLERAKEGLASVNRREGELRTMEKEILEKQRRSAIMAKSKDLADFDIQVAEVDLSDVEVRRMQEHLDAIRHALEKINDVKRPHKEAIAGAENALNEYERAEGHKELAPLILDILKAMEKAYPAYIRAHAGNYPSALGFAHFVRAAWIDKFPK